MNPAYERAADERVNLTKSIPFFLMHAAPLAALWTGARMIDWVVCFALYFARMFFITAGFHRYFSHRSYKLGRGMQLLMAIGGTMAAQKGPLWWASHHRHHHKYSDQPEDIHSPLRGLWWSHVGWILCNRYQDTDMERIKDFAKYPELRWLNRFYLVPPTALALVCFWAGGWSMLVIGFFLSTVLTYHCTFFINSLTHLFGRRRYVTTDTSRNSFILAILTLGEGWHNNHHYYQSSVNQGFYWWEVDISYYIVKMLSWVGLAEGLRGVPDHVRDGNKLKDGHLDVGMFDAHWAKAMASLTSARRQTGQYASTRLIALEDARRKALEDLRKTTRDAAEKIAAMPIEVTGDSIPPVA
jgi:stearoyl-CoA desaturase (delta-9 desaturase)